MSLLTQRPRCGALGEKLIDPTCCRYCIYSADSLFDEVIRRDELRDRDREEDHDRPKLTMTEAVAGLAFSVALVTLLLVCA